MYDDKLQKLKKQSLDFRARLREHNARPKALEALRNSLNLSRTFLVQINNLTDKVEIYTAKDLEELQKIINETTVRAVSKRRKTFSCIPNFPKTILEENDFLKRKTAYNQFSNDFLKIQTTNLKNVLRFPNCNPFPS